MRCQTPSGLVKKMHTKCENITWKRNNNNNNNNNNNKKMLHFETKYNDWPFPCKNNKQTNKQTSKQANKQKVQTVCVSLPDTSTRTFFFLDLSTTAYSSGAPCPLFFLGFCTAAYVGGCSFNCPLRTSAYWSSALTPDPLFCISAGRGPLLAYDLL